MLFPENNEKSFVETFTQAMFGINSKAMFDKLAMEVFHYQYQNNHIYKNFVDLIHVFPSDVDNTDKIPFLPIELFKKHEIITGNKQYVKVFSSSGTTGSLTSKHFVKDLTIYERSFRKSFQHFYSNIEEYCILALLPSYLEREGSSLVYMVADLIKKSNHPQSGFFLDNTDDLMEILKIQHDSGGKVILLGVSYALLDLIEKKQLVFPNLIIMETGGMKGRRKELIKEELHEKLCKGFSVKQIHAEYGMTELLSQAYSNGKGIFNCPPWMEVKIRDIYAPSYILGNNKIGGINIIDLANINSCCFIETQDLGLLHEDNSFEVKGRMDNSDIRGCNLLVN